MHRVNIITKYTTQRAIFVKKHFFGATVAFEMITLRITRNVLTLG